MSLPPALRCVLLVSVTVLGSIGLQPASAGHVSPQQGAVALHAHSIPGMGGVGSPGYDCAGNAAATLPIGNIERIHPPPPYITWYDQALGTGGDASGWKIQLQYQDNPATVGVQLINDTTGMGGWWASGRIGSIAPLTNPNGKPNNYMIGLDTNYAFSQGLNMEGLEYNAVDGKWHFSDANGFSELAPLQPGAAGGTWALWLDCQRYLHVFIGTSDTDFTEANPTAGWWQRGSGWDASSGLHISAQVSADSSDIQGSLPPVLTPIGNVSYAAQWTGIPPWVTIHWGKSANTFGPVTYATESPFNGAGSPTTNKVGCPCTAYPINTDGGDFYHTFDDHLTLPGRGIALQFTQTYDSFLARQGGPLGYGWTDNYNMYLTQDGSGNIWVHEEGGTAISLSPSGSTYTPPSYVLGTLVDSGPQGNCPDTLTFTRNRSQDHYVFCKPTSASAPGQLLSESDRNGYITTLSYSNGLLSTVTDPAGRYLSFHYSGGTISSIDEVAGGQTVKTVDFGFNDGNGNLTDLTDANGGHSFFTYDGNHQLATMEDPRQYALHGAISTGPVVTNTYNSDGRVTQQTDPRDKSTTFRYADNGDGTQTTTVTDPNGNITRLTYQNNTLISKIEGYNTAQQAEWDYQYDPVTLGVKQITDPRGKAWNYTYDPNGNMLTSQQPQVTGESSRRTTTYTYNSFNEPLTVTDPLQHVTTYQYDTQGNLISVSRPAPAGSQPHLRTRLHRHAVHHPASTPSPTRHPGHAQSHTAAQRQLASSPSDIPSLRTQTSRTSLQNGRYVASIYPGPVNYQDSSGAWQPIDTTLVPSSTTGYALQNKANVNLRLKVQRLFSARVQRTFSAKVHRQGMKLRRSVSPVSSLSAGGRDVAPALSRGAYALVLGGTSFRLSR